MLLHGSYGRSNAMSDSHEGQVRSSRSVPLEGQGSTGRASAYMPEFKANWIGTALNKANYLAEEKDRDGQGSSGSRSSKKPSENQRPSSKSISIMSSNAAATVSTSSPGDDLKHPAILIYIHTYIQSSEWQHIHVSCSAGSFFGAHLLPG